MYPAGDPRLYKPEDFDQLRTMAAEGSSLAEMAEALGRSIGSIRGTCWNHKIKTVHGRRGGTPCHKNYVS